MVVIYRYFCQTRLSAQMLLPSLQHPSTVTRLCKQERTLLWTVYSGTQPLLAFWSLLLVKGQRSTAGLGLRVLFNYSIVIQDKAQGLAFTSCEIWLHQWMGSSTQKVNFWWKTLVRVIAFQKSKGRSNWNKKRWLEREHDSRVYHESSWSGFALLSCTKNPWWFMHLKTSLSNGREGNVLRNFL